MVRIQVAAMAAMVVVSRIPAVLLALSNRTLAALSLGNRTLALLPPSNRTLALLPPSNKTLALLPPSNRILAEATEATVVLKLEATHSSNKDNKHQVLQLPQPHLHLLLHQLLLQPSHPQLPQ
jgi:hypothetical protein